MVRKRPRGLDPDEAALWERVADSARALHPKRKAGLKKPKAAALKPDPKPSAAEPFRLGAAAPKRAAAQGLPFTSSEAAAAPLRMDRKAFNKMVRGKLRPEGKIDLHGMTLAQAHPALVGFVLGAQARGSRLILVVTGKGRAREADRGPIPAASGALRSQVPRWLAQPPLSPAVLQVSEAHQSHGGSGAYYVYLRRQPGPGFGPKAPNRI